MEALSPAVKAIQENKRHYEAGDQRYKSLNLNSMGLDKFPEEAYDCVWIERLDFSRNNLTIFPDLSIFSELNQVNGNDNSFIEIEEISCPNDLEVVTIENCNQLTQIKSIKNGDKLKELELNHNNLHSIPLISQLPSLHKLSANGNSKLRDLSFINQIHNLKTLILVSISLESLENIRFLRSLKYLYIESRMLSNISGIEALTNLETLDLGFCSIQDGSLIANCIKLNSLSLESNMLQDVSFLASLTNLEHLNLENNKINWISSISGLSKLEGLHISGNNIFGSLHLGNATNLTLVACENNKITDFSFYSPSKLTHLYASNNNIKSLDFISIAKELKELSVASNPISDLSPVSNLDKLEKLNIDRTQVSSLTPIKMFIRRHLTNHGILHHYGIGPVSGCFDLIDPPFATAKQGKIAIAKYLGISVDHLSPHHLKEKIEANEALAKVLHSDKWKSQEEDHLNYSIIADLIKNFLKDEKTTPPLTIGIFGPWGMGKTTIMKMIEGRIKSPEQDINQKKKWYQRLFYDIKKRFLWKNQMVVDKIRSEINTSEKGLGNTFNRSLKKLENPTVWFNPWKYQTSEQIWSGMADEVVKQLVEKLPAWNRENFWLTMNYSRIDFQEVRKVIHQKIFSSTIWVIAVTALVLIIFVMSFIIIVFWNTLGMNWIGLFSKLSLLLLTSFYLGIFLWSKLIEKNIVAKFMKSPSYVDSPGMFHFVNQDLEKIFEELVSTEKPAIIFIDDLDRCSPQKIVEVLEAINLFTNGVFREKCYFVLGLDMEVVAAAIDVAYPGMSGKLPNHESKHGSVGWYFLDKLIQLPIFIPSLDQKNAARLFKGLSVNPEFETQVPPENKSRGTGEPNREVSLSSKNGVSTDSNITTIETHDLHHESTRLEKKAHEAYRKAGDSETVLALIPEFLPFLEQSPRSIVRFTNLLRFHESLQRIRSEELKQPALVNEIKSLAFWVVISLRWPQLVRWLQWEASNYSINLSFSEKDHLSVESYPSTAKEKAKLLDKLFREISRIKNDQDYAFQRWKILGENNSNLSWLKSKELFLLVHTHYSEQASFERAIACNFW